uniref:Uncharacterized protein n=1 Tax=Nelumbo nucifera TaxID=4432 RepID=A0A822Y3Z8_NELNU|nr:TPA_asm: hypothetical protein HUJ06_027497 [Nelumbo nucifera]
MQEHLPIQRIINFHNYSITPPHKNQCTDVPFLFLIKSLQPNKVSGQLNLKHLQGVDAVVSKVQTKMQHHSTKKTLVRNDSPSL